MSESNWLVEVGVTPGTGRDKYREFEGRDLWGPFTQDEATEFMGRVRDAWDGLDPVNFVYGTPYTNLVRIADRAHPIYDPAAVAARNWYLEPDDQDD